MAATSMTRSIQEIEEINMEILDILASMTEEEHSFEYDQRVWWEKLLRRPKRMKKATYEVEIGKIDIIHPC